MGKTAIILGITGVTGELLAHKILKDPEYDALLSFHRRKSGISHPKLTEHVVDVLDLESQRDAFKGDVVFCCIGTTQSKTSDKEQYKAIDYGIPVAAAKLCKENNIPKLILISALGADAGSSVFYNKVKGEMERDVLAQNLPETYLLEPSLIDSDREEKRTFEAIGISVFKVLNPILIGPLKKYRSIKAETIARAMLYLGSNSYNSARITSEELKKIADKNA